MVLVTPLFLEPYDSQVDVYLAIASRREVREYTDAPMSSGNAALAEPPRT